jgi:DNA-binding MarR family transcriptional regulator
MPFDFSQTYLYKMHKLTSSLDTVFDQNLRKYADIGLSQFTLLLSVDQHQPVSQRKIATFLNISPGAISRQVEIAHKNGWITIQNDSKDRRGQLLNLTAKGKQKIADGIIALEQHVFQIFKDENAQTNLMGHIELLQTNINKMNNE